jgi:hypothetical protein
MSTLPPVSGNVAAILLGRSPRAFRRLVESGILSVEHGRIPLAAIEAHIGRTVTAADYGTAKAIVSSRYLSRREHGARCSNDQLPAT